MEKPVEKVSVPPPAEDKEKGDKKGCAKSFLMEEREEMDKMCESTPDEDKEEYHQPAKEKEAGGQGGGNGG